MIQRAFPHYRSPIFDRLDSSLDEFYVLTSGKSFGKIRSADCTSRSYVLKSTSYILKNGLVTFPFIFLDLIRIKPDVIVTEGGKNTINNIFIWLYCVLVDSRFIVWDLGKGHIMPVNRRGGVYASIQNFFLSESCNDCTFTQ
mgnify:CR=1 FL=1